MKRVIAWVLLLTMCLGLFAGCRQNEENPTTSVNVVDTTDLESALEYIKTVYKKVSEKTPKDFTRIGNVPVNGVDYEVVWSTDVDEEFVKIVKGSDGMVTIDVNEDVTEDVKYVLTATITDKAGNSVSHSWSHLLPAPSDDMVAIVEEAYALENGASMDYEVTLTGVITKIDTPWSDDYKNITVTIAVEGAEDKPIMCYRLKGDGAKDLKPGDTITVTGTIKNYNGTIEFDAGCTLDKVVAGEEIKAPEDPKQILKDAYALAQGGALPYKCTLTGVISKVDTKYSPQYKNVTVTMIVGGDTKQPVQCYRLAGTGADKIGKDDTITVTGWIVNYKGTVQFTQGCTLDTWQNTGKDEPKPEDTFSTTLVPEIVTEPKAGVAYKLFMFQKNYNRNYYLNGKMDGFYYATTYDPAKAVDVFVEEVSGGYRLYFEANGAKNYMEVRREYSSSTGKYHNNVVFTTSPTKVLKWNADIKSFTCDVNVDGTVENMWLGTREWFETFSASYMSYITGENAGQMDNAYFVARLATMKETKVSAEEKAFEQLKNDYAPTEGATATSESFTRKNVYEIDGKKVAVAWTVDNEAVTVTDNGDGTVTIGVTRGTADVPYVLTATITNGDKALTVSWECNVPALPPQGPRDIVEAAYKLGKGESMADEVTLTGFVLEVTTPYDSTYGNVTVSIMIEDMQDKPLSCFRLSGEGVDKIAFGDYITVTGTITNYNDTSIRFAQGCTLDARMTQKQLVDKVYALEAGETLPDPYVMIANVISIDEGYNATYGNMTITVAVPGCEDQPIKCFRMKGDAEMLQSIEVGGMVAVCGNLTHYSKNNTSSYQFASGSMLLDYAMVEAEEEKFFVPKVVETPETGKAYKFFLYQAKLDKNLYFAGTVSSSEYLETTDDATKAVDVYLEDASSVAEGAVRLYFMLEGEKQYIEIYKNSSNKIRHRIVAEPTMYYTYDETAKVYVATIDSKVYYTGTYNSFNTFSASETKYITGNNAANVGVSQFVACFATLAPAAQDVETKEPPVEFEKPYKYFLYQAKLEKALYFAGTVNSSGYLESTGDLNAAVDVYVEDASSVAEGAVRLYFMLEGEKQYIEIYKNSSNKIRHRIVAEPTMYYTYDDTAKTYVATIDSKVYYTGTYNSFDTFSASEIKYITGNNAGNVGVSQFVAGFGTVVVKEVTPVAVPNPAMNKPYKYALAQVKLEKVLYFAGTVNSSGYLETTDDMAEAVDVILEDASSVAEGAVRMYFMLEGEKQYIEIYKNSSNKIRHRIVAEPTMYYTYDETAKVYVATIDSKVYYTGTYNSFDTFSASETKYITGNNAANVGVSQFVACFAEIVFVEDVEIVE